MDTQALEHEFQHQVAEQVTLMAEGPSRYLVNTPFMFDDGDCLVIILKRAGDQWVFSDEGHTYMHLSLMMDESSFAQGPRQAIIAHALEMYGITDQKGELILPIKPLHYGEALYDFIQGLLKISDVTYLTHERVHSTFLDDFRAFMEAHVPPQRRIFDWYDLERDPDGKYIVDCRVNGMERPLFVYALPNEARVRDATISILTLKQWELSFQTMAIFANADELNRRVLFRFTDVCERMFSNLTENKDRIADYLRQVINP